MAKYQGKAVKGQRGFASEGKNIGSKVGTIGVKFPEDIDEALRTLPNRSEYIRSAVITFLGLNSRSVEILESSNNRSQVIDEAFALLEENGLLDELNKRLDT